MTPMALSSNFAAKPFESLNKPDNRNQPWKVFWPPVDDKAWQDSEFPEVVSWNFDSNQPFTRPWRMWTRTARAKEENTVPSSTDLMLAKEDRQDDDEAKDLGLQTFISKNMHLKLVSSNAFNYLAPLDLYITEKPYLSRLPSLSGFARTNIVGQSYPIQIHDVSGHEKSFTLDQSGFEFANFTWPLTEWTNSAICETYIPRLNQWIKERFNCSDVNIYAYSVRFQGCVRISCTR
jgi:hypothetical protein